MQQVAIVIGHNAIRQGAVSSDKQYTEYTVNSIVAYALKEALDELGFEVFLVDGKKDLSLKQKTATINSMKKVDICLELHCNSVNYPTANGTETLHWHTSKKGKKLATCLTSSISKGLGTLNRGAKAIKLRQRGWYFLKNTKPVACILEPFFLSHIEHKRILTTDFPHRYVNSIVFGLKSYYGMV